jgi:hypothetical protein
MTSILRGLEASINPGAVHHPHCQEAGPQVAAAAVGVCANFEMMNRVLDATGCPVPDSLHFVAGLLGIARHR